LGCYINQSLVNAKQITTQYHLRPWSLTLFDGKPSSAGFIEEFVTARLHVIGQTSEVNFDVTHLCGVDLVLGYSWLKAPRAVIDFGELSIAVEQPPEPKSSASTPFDNLSLLVNDGLE
jgi:hypothetical protein